MKNIERKKDFLQEGKDYYEKGNYYEAIKSFNLELDQGNKEKELFFRLGLAYKFIGKFDDSIKTFNKLLELDINDSLTYSNLASVYLCKRNYDLAIKNFKLAIKNKPDDINSLHELGYCYYKKGDKEKAKEFLLAIKEIDESKNQIVDKIIEDLNK